MTNIPSVDCLFALIGRLVLSGVLSALIGLEREFRAKEAGLRTHFLVGVGSALFMIASQYGFADVGRMPDPTLPGVRMADAARVAAQIVSGIGFIGAGAIMVQRHYVRGLTTAAGLWVVAAIGMCAGGGLPELAIVGTIFALIGLELFRLLMKWVNLRIFEISFKADSMEAVQRLIDELGRNGCGVSGYKLVSTANPQALRVSLSARDRSRTGGMMQMYRLLSNVEGIHLESIE